MNSSAPALDCLTLRNLYPTIADGSYWIDPNGGSPVDSFMALCDMTMDGGKCLIFVLHTSMCCVSIRWLDAVRSCK